MWFFNISLKLLIMVLLRIIKIQADSSACELKEKHLASLDMAKDLISKAKDLHPTCVNDSKDNSNSKECGAKEKVSAYLDIAKSLIENAKENYSTCDNAKDLSKVVILHKKPIDCSEILESGETKSGEYVIWPRYRISDGKQLKVYCDMDTDGGGWTVIQRRGNFSNKVDFSRNWEDYKFGFGNTSEEFWIGNENIFALTNQRNYTLRFDLENVNKEHRFATYSYFWIEDENTSYILHYNFYNGTAGNGIESHNNMKFGTKDKENGASNSAMCAAERMGGWWYQNCGYTNPNGINFPGGTNDQKYMNWYPFTRYDSLLTIEIKIR